MTARGAGPRRPWTPDEMDRLERAIVDGDRVQIVRRGSEQVVVPREVSFSGGREVLIATSYTGDDLEFPLDEIESFDVLF